MGGPNMNESYVDASAIGHSVRSVNSSVLKYDNTINVLLAVIVLPNTTTYETRQMNNDTFETTDSEWIVAWM